MPQALMHDVSSEPEARAPLAYREALFVQSFVNQGCKNASEACRSLGYGGKNPDVTAARYLAKPRVQAAVQEALEKARKAQEVTVERIVSEYAAMGFGKHEGPILAGHKLQALEALGKYKRMFQPEMMAVVPVQFTITGGPPLVIDGEPLNDIGVQSAQDAPTLAQSVSVLPDKPEPKGR